MTSDEATRLRLERLEERQDELAVSGRQAERDVDRLKIELPRLEAALEKLGAEASTRHGELHRSLVRLHQRFDEVAADEHRAEGARSERNRLGKWIVVAVSAASAVTGAIVGVLELVLQHAH